MITETFFVETFCGAKCNVELEVIAKKDGRILVKGWNCYKELVKATNGRSYWMVDNEYKEIPEKWKVNGEENVKTDFGSSISNET